MVKYSIKFNFVGGTEKQFIIEKESYGHLASEIMNSSDGWFGIKGELVNLNNVTTCNISEIEQSEDHHSYKDEDDDYNTRNVDGYL